MFNDCFGVELILDLHFCNIATFNRNSIEAYFVELCVLIDMEREDLFWWDYEDDPKEYAKAPDHLKGVSAVQFIKTSNITIHTLDVLRCAYINIFSCKGFPTLDAANFTREWFQGTIVTEEIIRRK